MLFFSIYDEKQRSYRGKPVSEQWRHQALGRLELTLVVITSFLLDLFLLLIVLAGRNFVTGICNLKPKIT